ncbi:MAG: NTP transferase domain-containing protein [Chthoniobacterales bacterium]|nr:NTP transferase domain-containing protein [Chthoniobacterales bacterium]
MRAFVLCGGLGTRLRSVLSDRPKSMAPVAGVPFLQRLIEHLRTQGIGGLGTGLFGGADRRAFQGRSGFWLNDKLLAPSNGHWAPAARSSWRKTS